MAPPANEAEEPLRLPPSSVTGPRVPLPCPPAGAPPPSALLPGVAPRPAGVTTPRRSSRRFLGDLSGGEAERVLVGVPVGNFTSFGGAGARRGVARVNGGGGGAPVGVLAILGFLGTLLGIVVSAKGVFEESGKSKSVL